MNLFDKGNTPRRPKRYMAHVIDAGCGDTGSLDMGSRILRFGCKCGWESEWIIAQNTSEAKRGIPCPVCNGKESQGEAK